MQQYVTFYLGARASSPEANGYCGAGCGCPVDQTSEQLGVYAFIGGRMLLACDGCAEEHAPHLWRFLDVRLRREGARRIPPGPDAPAKFILIDAAEEGDYEPDELDDDDADELDADDDGEDDHDDDDNDEVADE